MPSETTPSAPPETRRLFVAIDAPPGVVAAMAELSEPLPGFVWAAPAQLHLTLRFLGETPVATLPALETALRAIRVQSFLLPLEGVGSFPPRERAQVVWCGVGTGHPRLHQLRQQVDNAVLACGLSPEMRSFVPHFTIARVGHARPGTVADFVHRHREFAAGDFRATHFRLYASELRTPGAVHTVLAEFPLAD